MVGHSWGGMNLQLFADQYPDLVAGLVLVDSSHPRGSEVFGPKAEPGPPEWVDSARSSEIVSTVSDLGVVPLVVLSQGLNDGVSPADALPSRLSDPLNDR